MCYLLLVGGQNILFSSIKCFCNLGLMCRAPLTNKDQAIRLKAMSLLVNVVKQIPSTLLVEGEGMFAL